MDENANASSGNNHCGFCRFKDTMANTVGHRTTEMALQLGLLYSPSEALKVGLVDQLVPEDQILSTATQTMTRWLAIPGTASPKSSLVSRETFTFIFGRF